MFMNTTGTIYTIISGMNETTGSLFLTFLLIILLIMVVFAVFGLAIEWSIAIVMPLMLALMAFDAAFYPAGAAMLLFLAIILAKNFFFTK